MKIQIDDLHGPEIAALLDEHLREMEPHSPPESRHALDLESLRVPEITFWSAWRGSDLLGCCALRELTPEHGELKSMRTAKRFLRQGIAGALLQHTIDEARRRGYARLSLETGSMEAFEPARALYRRFGFEASGPFGEYIEDPNTHFMELAL